VDGVTCYEFEVCEGVNASFPSITRSLKPLVIDVETMKYEKTNPKCNNFSPSILDNDTYQ